MTDQNNYNNNPDEDEEDDEEKYQNYRSHTRRTAVNVKNPQAEHNPDLPKEDQNATIANTV